MINCFIIDKDRSSIDLLANHITTTHEMHLVGWADNVQNGINKTIANKGRIDVIFLDVNPSDLSSIECEKVIKDHFSVIFTSASPDLALEAFERKALDYLLKPISYDRFLKSITRLKENRIDYNSRSTPRFIDYFFVQCETKRKLIRVLCNEIYYIESLKNYIIIYLKDEKFVTYLTMKEMEDYLSLTFFIRVHKSFIANLNFVKYIDGNQIVFTDKRTIIMGPKYKETVFIKIKEKIISSKRNDTL